MATLQKDPISGSYQVKSGDSLSKIAATQGRTLQELIASNPQYAQNPNLIQPGQTVNLGSPATAGGPSYQNLTSGSPTAQTNPTTNFTSSLIQMLKEAQQRDTAGQAGLMKQSQAITGQGITDAGKNFANPLLAPSSGTSLGLSAQNQFDPLQLSIANQQKLATQNLGNITDLVDRTQSSYDKEQDRIAKAKQDALDEKYRRDALAVSSANKSASFDNDSNIKDFATKFKSIKGADNYVDPYEWMAARDLWASRGGSDATFETNFKRFLNPASYKLAGYKPETGGVTEKQQALIDALKK